MAVLAVIAIPAMKASLGKAGDSANMANERAARAVAAASIMLDQDVPSNNDYFDNKTGKFDSAKPDAYGQTGTTTGTGDKKGFILQITGVNDPNPGDYTLAWVKHTT
jgi:type II secretory pathway pseudopilin PulG